MYDNVPEHIWLNMWSPYGQHGVFLAQTISQISSKISNFEHQISLGNVTLWCKNIHPLLLECFPTSCWCIRMIRIASAEICDPLVFNTVSFLPKTPLKCQVKISIVEHQISPENVTPLCHKDIHPLLLGYFLTSHVCLRRIERASDRI